VPISSTAPLAHNATVLIRLVLRAGVALACVSAVVVFVIARDTRLEVESAFVDYVHTRDAKAAVAGFERGRRLNPDYNLDIALARLQPEKGVAILSRALKREPENAELWVRLAQQQAHAGDRAAAKRSYARARELAPAFLPPDGPPAGL
jgi:tetratricopeptide (TPR) repeat protein